MYRQFIFYRIIVICVRHAAAEILQLLILQAANSDVMRGTVSHDIFATGLSARAAKLELTVDIIVTGSLLQRGTEGTKLGNFGCSAVDCVDASSPTNQTSPSSTTAFREVAVVALGKGRPWLTVRVRLAGERLLSLSLAMAV